MCAVNGWGFSSGHLGWSGSFLQNVRCGAHAASCSVDTGHSFSGVKWQGMKLATRLCLLQMLRISGTVLLLQLYAFTVCTATAVCLNSVHSNSCMPSQCAQQQLYAVTVLLLQLYAFTVCTATAVCRHSVHSNSCMPSQCAQQQL
jgi:hypothetical protein